MKLVGYTVKDMLPAFPGKDEAYVETILRDNAQALSRPVIPYGLLGINPCNSPHFNYTNHGFRYSGKAQPWPLDRQKRINIFFFGGSTTVGQNVSDEDAIPYILNNKLSLYREGVEVYNFGSGNYTSRHEALRLLDLVDSGIVPDIAVFLDGYNDSFYAQTNKELIYVLDKLFQGEKRRRRKLFFPALYDYATENWRARKKGMPMAHTLNIEDKGLGEVISDNRILKALSNSSCELAVEELSQKEVLVAKTVWSNYLRSVAIIRAIVSDLATQLLFVWQPVPYFRTRPEQRVMERLYPIFRAGGFSAPVYQWLHATKFPGMFGNADFINLAHLAENIDEVCYLDICHYTRALAEPLAEQLAAALLPRIDRVSNRGI